MTTQLCNPGVFAAALFALAFHVCMHTKEIGGLLSWPQALTFYILAEGQGAPVCATAKYSLNCIRKRKTLKRVVRTETTSFESVYVKMTWYRLGWSEDNSHDASLPWDFNKLCLHSAVKLFQLYENRILLRINFHDGGTWALQVFFVNLKYILLKILVSSWFVFCCLGSSHQTAVPRRVYFTLHYQSGYHWSAPVVCQRGLVLTLSLQCTVLGFWLHKILLLLSLLPHDWLGLAW